MIVQLVVSGDAQTDGYRFAERLRLEGVDILTEVQSGCPAASAEVIVGQAGLLLNCCTSTRAAFHSGRIVVALSGHELPDAITILGLLRAGANDVVVAELENASAQVAHRLARWERVDECIDAARRSGLAVGQSRAWIAFMRRAIELALFSRLPMVLSGETGTGKEQIARVVHEFDPRSDKGRFAVLDCATLVPELAGSEFFGHERGAFTGAASARDGAFALADGGTLFLDEIGELPLPLQGQLLRVIQEGTYKRVGGNAWKHVGFRLVCATNRDLRVEVDRGRFREDLFFRISGWTLRLPALRERREDVPELAAHFLSAYATEEHKPPKFHQELVSFLKTREYPGNVRELKHVVCRLADLHAGGDSMGLADIASEELPELMCASWFEAPYVDSLRRAVATRVGLRNILSTTRMLAVEVASELEGANVRRMAEKLRVSTVALYQKGRRPEAGPPRSIG